MSFLSIYLFHKAMSSRGDNDYKVPAIIVGGIMTTALVGGLVGMAVHNTNANKNAGKLNEMLTEDMRSSIECEAGDQFQSFHTKSIIFNENQPNIIRFVGNASVESGKEYNGANITYSVTDEQFSKMFNYFIRKGKVKKPDEIEVPDSAWQMSFEACRLMGYLLEILPDCEIVDASLDNISSFKSEAVLDFKTPMYEECSDEVWGDVTLIKHENGNIKIATIEISAKATDELKANPKLLFTMPKESLNIKVENIETYQDDRKVIHAGDDWTIC